MHTVIETETTGPVVRVWIAADSEDGVADAARDHLGVDALAEVVYHPEGVVYEVIFESADVKR